MSFENNQRNGGWMSSYGQEHLTSSVAGKTIAGVYGWMALGVLLSAVVGFALIDTGSLARIMQTAPSAFMGIMILQFAVVLVMTLAINKLSSGVLKLMFLSYAALTGFTFAIIASVYNIGDVVSLFAVAAAAFSGLALFGLTTKKDLGFMGTFLMMGLFMLIGAGLLNLFIHSPMIYKLSGWIGIIVFSGLTAYDSQRVRQQAYSLSAYSAGQSEVMGRFMISNALSMYLNFINLFLSLVQSFARRD